MSGEETAVACMPSYYDMEEEVKKHAPIMRKEEEAVLSLMKKVKAVPEKEEEEKEGRLCKCGGLCFPQAEAEEKISVMA